MKPHSGKLLQLVCLHATFRISHAHSNRCCRMRTRHWKSAGPISHVVWLPAGQTCVFWQKCKAAADMHDERGCLPLVQGPWGCMCLLHTGDHETFVISPKLATCATPRRRSSQRSMISTWLRKSGTCSVRFRLRCRFIHDPTSVFPCVSMGNRASCPSGHVHIPREVSSFSPTPPGPNHTSCVLRV